MIFYVEDQAPETLAKAGFNMNHRAIDTYSEGARDVESNSLYDYWLYLQSFVKRGVNVASLVPSSRWTAQSMLRGIDFSKCQTVMELGAGTGAVTALLLQAARGNCRTLIVERDPVFCKRLSERFPDAEIVAGDALQLPQILEHHGVGQIDHVLSTLPINWLPPEQRRSLLGDICRYLQADGSYRQLAHLPWLQQEVYKQHFASVQCPIVLRNLPPAWCYVCREPLACEMHASTS